MLNFYQFENFSGNAQDLADAALTCAEQHNWPIDTDKTNERLVRYYVTVQVLDKPNRVGRDATYQYRHLLQLLVARRMLDKGFNLASIADLNQNSATSELVNKLLSKEFEITDAQALIRKFKTSTNKTGFSGSSRPLSTFGNKNQLSTSGTGQTGLGASASVSTSTSTTTTNSGTANPRIRPPMAIQDVLEEVKRLKSECMHQISFLYPITNEVAELKKSHDSLQKFIDHRTQNVEVGFKRLENLLVEKHISFETTIEAQIQNYFTQSNAQQEKLIIAVEQLEKKLDTLLKNNPSPPDPN